jgi:hypothetical protein
MTMIKSLILGSTAGLIAMSGAQAADLPVKAKAVEYVKICSLYGAGFYYIPGTDTCIKIGGAIRLDTAFNGSTYDVPFWQGGAGGNNLWTKNYLSTRERFNLTSDTRTATEYGVVRTYANLQFDFLQDRESIAGGYVEVDYAFIQFAGFTFGKAVSQFDPQWALSKPYISSGFNAGSNNATGIPQLAYTASFGNGVSGSISVENASPYRNAGLWITTGTITGPGASTFTVPSTARTRTPSWAMLTAATIFLTSSATSASIRLGAPCTSVPRCTLQPRRSTRLRTSRLVMRTTSTASPLPALSNSRTCLPARATA